MLESTWFVIWAILWGLYFVLDGFDLGLGSMMPFLARGEKERRIVYNAMGPFWDGNEVWLITAGGVTFAAFPAAYAVMFSGMYTALMLLLFALILRGVAFEFRNKVDSPAWRRIWDWALVLGSFLPALLLGVAFANIFMGIPIDADGVFQGSILTLLNPYGLAGGALFVLLFLVHGCLWLAVRSMGELRDRAGRMAGRLWFASAGFAVLFLLLTAVFTRVYDNYLAFPVLWLILVLPLFGLVLTRIFISAGKWAKAWGASALTIMGTAMIGMAGIYPALLPSSLNPVYSLTIHNSSSSPLTLKIMLGVALVFVPVVLIYQAWVYKKFSHQLDFADLEYDGAY